MQICPQCLHAFTPRKGRGVKKRTFCSTNCANEFQKDEITKNCKICGDKFKVVRCYDDRYSTCSKSECRAKNKQKEHNGMWAGGVARERSSYSQTTAHKEWRLGVFKRDNYTCQICGKRGGTLNADHVKPWAFFPELRLSLDNGRTLCVPCHKSTYKYACSFRARKGEQGVNVNV